MAEDGACGPYGGGGRTSRMIWTVPASEAAARQILVRMMAQLRALGIDGETRGTVEIAVAEVVNNVVEHAYGGLPAGPVIVALDVHGANLDVTVRDRGKPLSEEATRLPVAADHSGPLATLPEGGYGRLLIQSLARDLSYQRKRGENRLWMRFVCNSPQGRGR